MRKRIVCLVAASLTSLSARTAIHDNSYLVNPSFPEWLSAHAVVGAAMAKVLAD
jgi:hypothetical protein